MTKNKIVIVTRPVPGLLNVWLRGALFMTKNSSLMPLLCPACCLGSGCCCGEILSGQLLLFCFHHVIIMPNPILGILKVDSSIISQNIY